MLILICTVGTEMNYCYHLYGFCVFLTIFQWMLLYVRISNELIKIN